MTFRVGQKVVCIKNYSGSKEGGYPKKGEVCAVSKLVTAWTDGSPAIELHEYNYWNVNEVMHFYARNFRPVVDRKTDISVFHEILRKASKRVSA